MRSYFTTYFLSSCFCWIGPDFEVGVFFNWYRRFYFLICSTNPAEVYVNHAFIFHNIFHLLYSFVEFSRTLKLVFSSLDIAGSISWFAVLILQKCKSCVHISQHIFHLLHSFVEFSRTLKLVFSSIDFAGSISWFAVLILQNCK